MISDQTQRGRKSLFSWRKPDFSENIFVWKICFDHIFMTNLSLTETSKVSESKYKYPLTANGNQVSSLHNFCKIIILKEGIKREVSASLFLKVAAFYSLFSDFSRLWWIWHNTFQVFHHLVQKLLDFNAQLHRIFWGLRSPLVAKKVITGMCSCWADTSHCASAEVHPRSTSCIHNYWLKLKSCAQEMLIIANRGVKACWCLTHAFGRGGVTCEWPVNTNKTQIKQDLKKKALPSITWACGQEF